MGKFYGKIGFSVTEETQPGIWKERIVERSYYGDTVRSTKQISGPGKINDDITIKEDLSVLADPFAMNHYSSIKYVEYMQTKWKVTAVEVKFPRLILTTGSVYNG